MADSNVHLVLLLIFLIASTHWPSVVIQTGLFPYSQKRGTDWRSSFGSQSYVQRKGLKGGQAQPCPGNPISRDSRMELTCCYTFAAALPQLQPVRSCLNASRVCCRKQLLPAWLPCFPSPPPRLPQRAKLATRVHVQQE